MYTQYILRHFIKDIFLLHSRIITEFLKYHLVNDGLARCRTRVDHVVVVGVELLLITHSNYHRVRIN
jgi:hypothetical protein